LKLVISKELSPEDKARYAEICNEIIYILRAKHHLTSLQCGSILTWLLDSLKETLGPHVTVEFTHLNQAREK